MCFLFASFSFAFRWNGLALFESHVRTIHCSQFAFSIDSPSLRSDPFSRTKTSSVKPFYMQPVINIENSLWIRFSSVKLRLKTFLAFGSFPFLFFRTSSVWLTCENLSSFQFGLLGLDCSQGNKTSARYMLAHVKYLWYSDHSSRFRAKLDPQPREARRLIRVIFKTCCILYLNRFEPSLMCL